MVDTNALLSIAFALIANFTNSVPVPPNSAPTSTNDLKRYILGSPRSPVDVVIFGKRGTCILLQDGVVQGYTSPNTYFFADSPRSLTNHVGTAILDSNQVLHLASTIINRLAKGSNHLASVTPEVRRANEPNIPFYRISWPDPDPKAPIYYRAAEMEIDARRAQVVSISLLDRAFCDYPYAEDISNRVYKAEPKPPVQRRMPDRKKFRAPTLDEVQAGITNWLFLCAKLAIPPGSDQSLARLDWDRSYVYTNHVIGKNLPVCQMYFKNGTCFECTGGVVFSCFSQDAYYTSTTTLDADWAGAHGKVTKRWQDLAKGLQQRLADELGVSQALLASFPPELDSNPALAPVIGTEGITRCVVKWHDREEDARRSGTGIEPRGAFVAEFDLQSGATKWVAFQNAKLIEALAHVQLGER